MLNLPLYCLILCFLAFTHLLVRRRENRLWHIEERELAEEALKALLLGRPVDLNTRGVRQLVVEKMTPLYYLRPEPHEEQWELVEVRRIVSQQHRE